VDAALVTEGPDELIHQPVRLRIMAALTALDPGEEGLDFTRLKSLTGATDGNLGAHLDQLARAGYVEATKAFVGRRPRTTVTATAAGRAAFAHHVAFLKAIIAGT
jgi:DNA-binding MarR family transcriptional regulator